MKRQEEEKEVVEGEVREEQKVRKDPSTRD